MKVNSLKTTFDFFLRGLSFIYIFFLLHSTNTIIMFNDLPLEILLEIFVSLHQQNKVECMTVCHYWKVIIQTHCLFDTLRIENWTQMDMVTKKLEEDPSRRNQVAVLALDFDLGVGFDAGGYIGQFSNLQYIYMIHAREVHFRMMTPSSIQSSRIKFIYEQPDNFMTINLLKTTTFPQLTEIDIYGPSSNVCYRTVDIIPLLAQAPCLESLTVPIIKMTLKKFETMHSSLPFLKHLTTELVLGDIANDPLPTNILPANSMETVTIKFFYRQDNEETKLFQYFRSKYPNLKVFNYASRWFQNAHNHNIQEFCQLGLYPFLQEVAYKLEEYAINMDIDNSPGLLPNYFGVLDKTDCKITEVAFDSFLSAEKLGQFMQSSLIKNVKGLGFYNVEFRDFKLLAELPLLTNFILEHKECKAAILRPAIALNELFGYCPKLDTLKISDYLIKFNLADTQQYSVTSFNLHNCNVPKGFDFFISKCLPHLCFISLNYCTLHLNAFFMPDIRLQFFGVNSCGISNVLVHTNNDKQQRWWTIKNKKGQSKLAKRHTSSDAHIIHAIAASPISRLDAVPSMTLVCESLDLIDISNFK
jgi:hypothetical protein